MGQRCDTGKRWSNIKHQSLAERLFELRELRELVRKTETRADEEEVQRGLLANVHSRTIIPSEVRTPTLTR
jgi:hypothetical protein